MPNPFYVGGHIEPNHFVGRRDELIRIFSALDVTHTGKLQSTSVYGPRGIGKSSLLYYIAHRFEHHLPTPDKYRFAYLSLKDPEYKTQKGLLNGILSAFKLPRQTSGNRPLMNFQEEIRAFRTKGGLPVVLLDGFAELTDKPTEFNSETFDAWRTLIGDGTLAFITASSVPLSTLEEVRGHTSRFSNIFSNFLQLQELAPEAAEELIQRGGGCDRPFTADEQRRMRDLGARYPYKLQLAGSLIYNAKHSNTPINWKLVRADFDRQVDALRGADTTLQTRRANLLHRIAAMFRPVLMTLGRITLGLLKINANDQDQLIVGAGVTVIVILILIGVLNPQALIRWFRALIDSGS